MLVFRRAFESPEIHSFDAFLHNVSNTRLAAPLHGGQVMPKGVGERVWSHLWDEHPIHGVKRRVPFNSTHINDLYLYDEVRLESLVRYTRVGASTSTSRDLKILQHQAVRLMCSQRRVAV